MNTQTEPRTGDIFECVKSNKQHSAVKGKFYLYDGGELKTYTSRNVTLLANGDEMLELPGVFEPAKACPFCGMEAAAMTVTQHDGVECAAAWDAKTKGYCQDCNADLVAGKCPKCDA
jgi:hypothetical protein